MHLPYSKSWEVLGVMMPPLPWKQPAVPPRCRASLARSPLASVTGDVVTATAAEHLWQPHGVGRSLEAIRGTKPHTSSWVVINLWVYPGRHDVAMVVPTNFIQVFVALVKSGKPPARNLGVHQALDQPL